MAKQTSLQLDAHTTLADVVRFAQEQPWPAPDPAHADDLRLLLEELLSNLVRHAFAGHAAPLGVCQVAADSDGARIDLRDNGVPFNPFDPSNPPGYGLTLVRALVSRWCYGFEEEQNRIQLQINLAEPPA